MKRSRRFFPIVKKLKFLSLTVCFSFGSQVLAEEVDVMSELQPSLQLLIDGEFSKSLEIARKLSESYPKSELVWSAIARNYFFLKEYESARIAFEKFLSLNGDFEVIASEYILTLLFLDDMEEFGQWGDRILGLDSDSLAISVAQLAILCDRGEREKFDNLLVELPDEILETRIAALTIARSVWYFSKENNGGNVAGNARGTPIGSDAKSKD